MKELRDYQRAAHRAILAEMAAGRNRLLLQMGTGSGKTYVAAMLLQDPEMRGWLAQYNDRDRRILFFVHRQEIVEQAAEAFKAANPGLMVSIEQGPSRANRYADVVVASIQTLAASNYRRLHDLIRYRPFRLVFSDEAHRATASTYRTTLAHLGFLPPEDIAADDETEPDIDQLQANLKDWDSRAPNDRVLIGLTATPNRSDGIGLGAVFQSIAFSFPLRRGIDEGYLVPIVPWVVDTSTSLDAVRMNRGDFNQGDLQRTVNTDERNRLTVAGWLKFAAGRPTIAFTAGVGHAHALAEEFNAAGVVARPVSGETPKDERRSILEQYRAGAVTLLANDSVFTEGTDLPNTACVLMAKPTKSALVFEQQLGRGLRLHPGKSDCVVIDVVDVARKHSLMTAPALFGLPPKLYSEKGKSLSELAAAWEQFAEQHPGINIEKMGRIAIEQLAVKASTFNLWEVPALGAFAAGRAMQWVKVGENSFRLQFPWQDGTETISVAANLLGQYEVVGTFRPNVGNVRQRTLVSNLDSAMVAADYAERFIQSERPGVARLTDKNASWRGHPASDRQKKWLKWKRIPFRDDITKGEAGALMDLVNAKVGR